MRHLFLKFIYGFVGRWFLRIIVGVRFQRANFLQNENQFIIVANHNSHLDTISILSAVPSCLLSSIKPVAAIDHFGKTQLKAKLTSFFTNALLIQRKRCRDIPENDPIYQMIKALDTGYSLLLYPEGTRGEPEKKQSMKKGIGILLNQRPHIKYVPVFIKNMGKAMPKGDGLVVPCNSSLTFGRPTKIKSADVDSIMNQIESDLAKLENKNYQFN